MVRGFFPAEENAAKWRRQMGGSWVCHCGVLSNAIDSKVSGTGNRDDKGRDGSSCNGTGANVIPSSSAVIKIVDKFVVTTMLVRSCCGTLKWGGDANSK